MRTNNDNKNKKDKSNKGNTSSPTSVTNNVTDNSDDTTIHKSQGITGTAKSANLYKKGTFTVFTLDNGTSSHATSIVTKDYSQKWSK
jgi:hypothetical protein